VEGGYLIKQSRFSALAASVAVTTTNILIIDELHGLLVETVIVTPAVHPRIYSRWHSEHNLPTSLTYIVLSTRSCSLWRPAADIGTVRHENHTVSTGFSRDDVGAPDTAESAVLYGSEWVSEQFLNGTSAHRRPFQCHSMVLSFKNEIHLTTIRRRM